MSREQEVNFGGGGVADEERDTRDNTTASGVTAQASGYANLEYLKTGDYFDLDSDGADISPTTDTFVASSVPPGNSYNADHYATDDGPGASVSEASSELIAATIRLEGEMRDAVTCDFTWLKPDGSVAWSGSASIDDPSTEQCDSGPCDWWTYVYFYSFIGRDFSHGANQEVSQRGTYIVEFDTNYGTYTETVEVIGPQLTSCSTPNSIQDGGSAEFGAIIEKPIDDDDSYNGDVVVAREMSSNYTTRDVIHREPFSIGSFQDVKGVSFDVSASAFDQFGGLGSDTPIMMWAETYGF